MRGWEQDPNEKVFYRQQITGDTVASAVWSITPAGPTLDGQSEGADYSRIKVSALTINKKYTLTCHIVGASGQEFERSCGISCVDL